VLGGSSALPFVVLFVSVTATWRPCEMFELEDARPRSNIRPSNCTLRCDCVREHPTFCVVSPVLNVECGDFKFQKYSASLSLLP
jgi:hypothetical protein